MGKPLAERPLQTPEEFAYHLSERYGFIAFEMQAVIAEIAARDAKIAEEARQPWRTALEKLVNHNQSNHLGFDESCLVCQALKEARDLLWPPVSP